MDKKTRIQKIEKKLKEQLSIELTELAYYLDVSEMTVRRDVDSMRGIIPVSIQRGLVVYDKAIEIDSYDYKQQALQRIVEKKELAEEVINHVSIKMTVIFDIGTTSDFIIDALPYRYQITAICSSVYALNKLMAKKIEDIIMLGGKLRYGTGMLESYHAIEYLKSKRADLYLVSAASISEDLDYMCENEYEVLTKKESFKTARKSILVADSDKFGKVSPSLFASKNDVDMIITNKNIDPKFIKKFKEYNIEYILV